jgi:hypothetical protein
MTMTRVRILYTSGREDTYEVDFTGSELSHQKLQSWMSSPRLILQTEEALVIIPSSGIEKIMFELTGDGSNIPPIEGLRRARKLT